MTLSVLLFLGILFSLISAASEALFLKRRAQGLHRISLFYKMLASAGFCGVGLLTASQSNTPWAWAMLLGLLLGFLGDVLLGLRKLCKKDQRLFFLLGMIAFSFGHFCYVHAINHLEAFSPLPVLSFFALLMLSSEAFLYVHKVKDPAVHICGLLYVAIEAFMSAMALILAYSHTSLGSLLLVTGSFSFFASDNLLCAYSFGNLKNPEIDHALHVTYLSAQLFIAWSILFL